MRTRSLVFLAVVLAACQAVRADQPAAPGPLSFDAEVVRLFVEEDSVRVDGNYFLSCAGGRPREFTMHYPYPVDDRLGGARTLLLEYRTGDEPWQPMRFREVGEGRGALWRFPVVPGQPIEIHAVYRQSLSTTYARYIVTTTRAWDTPLRNARFEIHLPPGARPVAFSFPFELRETSREAYYSFEADDFWPDRDIVVEWE